MDKETLVADDDADPSYPTDQSITDMLAEFRDIPFYANKCKYPWEEDEEDIKANEYDGIDYNKLSSKPWSPMPYTDTSADPQQGEWSDMASTLDASLREKQDSPPHTDTAADPQQGEWNDMASTLDASLGEKVDSPQPLFTSDEVLRVRLDMYHLKESQNSEEGLFNCQAAKEELRVDFTLTMTYSYHAIRDGIKAKSYPHFFHQFIGKYSSPCWKYIQPTTLDGDLQYIEFFDKLMESARYRETRDGVLAKAIVMANKFFNKMLFFQIEIAVNECLQLMEHLEKMGQRHALYYYIVHEVLIKRNERQAIIDQIREGKVQLFYDLTEFSSLDLEDCEYTVQDTVDCLIDLTGAKSPPKKSVKDGTYKRTICKEVDKLFPRDIQLYTYFLKKKMETAEEHNVIPKGTCERLGGLFSFDSRVKELELTRCITCYCSVKGFAYPTAEGAERKI